MDDAPNLVTGYPVETQLALLNLTCQNVVRNVQSMQIELKNCTDYIIRQEAANKTRGLFGQVVISLVTSTGGSAILIAALHSIGYFHP